MSITGIIIYLIITGILWFSLAKQVDKDMKIKTVQGFSIILLIAGLTFSFVDLPFLPEKLAQFIISINPELISISLGVLLIDELIQRRAKEEEKEKLIFQMGSDQNYITQEAARNLRFLGYITDGSLNGKSFWSADLRNTDLHSAVLRECNLGQVNFQEANLNGVDFSGSDLNMANLKRAWLHGAVLRDCEFKYAYDFSNFAGARLLGADLTGSVFWGLINHTIVEDYHPHLIFCRQLRWTILPDGKKYDGRYRLPDEINRAILLGYNHNDPSDMAEYYEVPFVDYLDGQEWAETNLGRFQQIAMNNEIPP